MLFWNHEGIRWSEFIKVSCEQWIVNALPSEIGIKYKFSCVLTLKKKKYKVKLANQVLFWGKMKTVAWETALQMAPRVCSKEAGWGECQEIRFW